MHLRILVSSPPTGTSTARPRDLAARKSSSAPHSLVDPEINYVTGPLSNNAQITCCYLVTERVFRHRRHRGRSWQSRSAIRSGLWPYRGDAY
ncbi:hypothetical protein GWI33_003940 [Rhynchophorus ferrugineus]|uniref:Uncharacterized protein n=1 Tax=Rhynchophorus ferrugineus TaxID=354439 RepID=A0A834M0R5_RHYFE|nr:hypothetical protein GWI33_003945 [Rhynchophorus ferrugineus]KAF7262880.1 hypothetical protein GWI33_003940 [Rhynchophorus ferrugineus]